MKANFATFANALCHLNATPLSVAVLAPCVWGENLACGVAWQRVLNSAELGVASLATKRQSVAKFNGTAKQAQQIQCGECLWAKQAKRKWSSVWAGDFSLSLSLVARTFWQAFALNLKGFFTHFVVVSSRFIINFSYFIVVFSRLFTHKRHFLGHCAFLKFLNALFLGFCALFVILSLCKKATQRVARRSRIKVL